MKPKEYDLVIACSGGIDSTLAWYYAIREKGYDPKKILCMYVDLHHPYSWKEKKGLKQSGIPYKIIDTNIIREEFGNIPQPIHPYSIILNRNVLIAVYGSMLGKKVWVSSLEDEMHKFALERDKSPEFFHLMSGLLSYTSAIRREETIIETPFKHMTKAELIHWALDNKVPKRIILNTHTCYDDKKEKCGKCFVCFKRKIAFILNGLDEKYASDPFKSKEAQRLIKAYKEAWQKQDFSHYHKKRVTECFDALTLEGIDFGMPWKVTKKWRRDKHV